MKADELADRYGTDNAPVILGDGAAPESADGPPIASDVHVARLFAEREVGRLIHTPGMGWMAFDGRVWIPDPEAALRAGIEVAQEVATRYLWVPDKAVKRRAIDRCQAPRVKATLALAAADERIHTPADRLDAHQDLLAAENGIVDLRTGKLQPHDPTLLITKLAGAAFEPDARSPLWERFLADLTGGDEDDEEFRRYLQTAAGYSATGRVAEEVLFFTQGPTASGKSTFLAAIAQALGDRVATVDFSSFLHQRRDGSSASPDIAKLRGARLAQALEVAPNETFSASRVKTLTGRDPVTARGLYQAPFTFEPTFTIWLAANERPALAADDDAIWRRMRLLPFVHTVPAARRDPTLKDALLVDPEHRRAVLAWIVAGSVHWYRNRLPQCAAVELASTQYRYSADLLQRWISDRCSVGQDATAPLSALHASFTDWCHEHDIDPWKPETLGRALKHAGYSAKATRTGKAYIGLSVTV